MDFIVFHEYAISAAMLYPLLAIVVQSHPDVTGGGATHLQNLHSQNLHVGTEDCRTDTVSTTVRKCAGK